MWCFLGEREEQRMGWRFRKSFKIAPGIKLNLNKKSTSVTFGGKGFHYTVNSNGKKTKTAGIPGSGLYYTETTGGGKQNTSTSPPRPPIQNNNANPTNNGGRKKRGCLFYLLAFFAVCFAIGLYALAWIPAIGFIIYFIVKKDYNGTKRRNIGISIAVLVTSFIVFIGLSSSEESLMGITAEWGKTTYDVSETTEVKITPTPSDADITSLELSENNVAELDYSDGKAVITFKEAGEASVFFIADGDINSNTTTITVTDQAAEQAQKEAEEEAARKAEEEAEAITEQEAAEKAAAEQAAAQAQAEQEAAAQTQQPQEQMVWVSQSGSKYHSNSSCSNMKNPTQITISEARNRGLEPCKKCY